MSPKANAGFSTVELVVAVMLFSAATAGVLVMGKGMRDHRMAAVSANQQNAYATFQSQVALQGIDPTLVANPMADAISQGGTVTGQAATGGRNLSAAFEGGAVSQPVGAQRNLAGSVRVDALNYAVASAGSQATRGVGIGFTIETAGAAPAGPANAIPLAPPSFNVTGDLTGAAFPLNNLAVLPSGNPAGTVYRYTTDGSTPNGSSPVWDNNPGWTAATFPAQVTLEAFNPDPQYSPSPSVSASYSIQLSVTYARADGRAANLYDFTLADLGAPAVSGVVLTGNLDGFPVVFTLDGSDPRTSPSAATYDSAFAPLQAQFGPNVTLKVAALSNDPRVNPSSVTTYTLDPQAMALSAPSFITDNSQPLAPGTPVQISMNGAGGSPRTEINGPPTNSSSQSTSFPLN